MTQRNKALNHPAHETATPLYKALCKELAFPSINYIIDSDYFNKLNLAPT